MIVDTFQFDPPINGVTEINVYGIDDNLYDIYDQNGTCLNEGAMFPFLPTKAEVEEWITTGIIKGKME